VDEVRVEIAVHSVQVTLAEQLLNEGVD
jgi:hypothetical protein